MRHRHIEASNAECCAGINVSIRQLCCCVFLILFVPLCAHLAQVPGVPAIEARQDPEVFNAYVRALLALKDGAAVSAALASELPRQNDPERLRFLARAALQVDQPAAAAAAYNSVLQLKPDDPEALRWMGILLFRKAQYSASRQFLARYLTFGEGDYESLYAYAELLSKTGNRAEARPYYELALRQIEDTEPRPFDMKLTQAHILNRLGYTREAFAMFDSLIRQWPEDSNLRADYAGILIDRVKHKEAQRVLARP